MTADDLLDLVSHAIFLGIFAAALVQAIRRPRRARIDTALLFSDTALIIAVSRLAPLVGLAQDRWVVAFTSSLLMALPYLLVRLVEDCAGLQRWQAQTARVGLALSVLLLFAIPQPYPLWLSLLLVAYFVAFAGLASWAFARRARRGGGVTGWRMQAVAAGSACLGLVILLAGFEAVWPWLLQTPVNELGRLLGVLCGVCYFLGFAPPAALRRAWQEPELRAFLSRTSSLPHLASAREVAREVGRAAAAALGSDGAALGLWDEARQALVFQDGTQEFLLRPGEFLAGRAFAAQRAIFSTNAVRDDPERAQFYLDNNVVAVIAVPVTAGPRRLGVLVAYDAHLPIVAEDDLQLTQLLADQAAVVLGSQALIEEEARVRALEESTRLKDDFLSAAAHDLKTPLTTILIQAEMLERRARRNPQAPADLLGIQRLVHEARRLSSIVMELLDVSRLEARRGLVARETVDLAELVREAAGRGQSEHHTMVVDTPGPIRGNLDPGRLRQVIENLVDNAVKYSPQGGVITVRLWTENCSAHLTVADQGIGIPAADLPHIFDRFHRGANVDDRRFAGMGLGLYICRAIVEQHGGQISVTSAPGQGSTFHVVLPLRAQENAA